MIKKAKHIVMILAIAGLYSCECVPGIETPKNISPIEGTNIAIASCLSDGESISLYANSLEIAKGVTPLINEIDYSKAYIGDNFIQITAPKDIILFNGFLQLAKDSYYSLIAYGTIQRTRLLIMSDSVSQSREGGYLRIINLSSSGKTVLVKTGNSQSIELKFKSFTPLLSNKAELIQIEVIDSETNNQLIKTNVRVSSHDLNNMVILEDAESGEPYLKVIKNKL